MFNYFSRAIWLGLAVILSAGEMHATNGQTDSVSTYGTGSAVPLNCAHEIDAPCDLRKLSPHFRNSITHLRSNPSERGGSGWSSVYTVLVTLKDQSAAEQLKLGRPRDDGRYPAVWNLRKIEAMSANEAVEYIALDQSR